nr:reverse transcriptase domain-containing protein [Tanacetum cinerariifolium]
MFLGKYFPPSMVTKHINEITNFRQRPDESLFEAWECYKLLIDQCPNHNMFPVTQIDTFYNGLTLRHRDTINAAADGTFIKRSPEECYDLIENMTAHHNDWDTSAQQRASHGPNPPPAYQAPAYQAPGYQAPVHQPPIPQPQVVTPTEFTKYVKANNAILKNMQTNMTSLINSNLELKNMFGQFMKMNTASSSGSGTLPGNTITNLKEDRKGITTRSGTAYQGPTIPTTSSSLPQVVERQTEVTKDTVPPTNNGSTKDVQPPDKLYELARTLLNEHFSAILLKKLPEQLKDPGKFLIPCDFPRMDECLALADLGASINLMPLSVWNKLSLPEITPTLMTLKLTDRSISRPIGELTLCVGKETITFNLVQTSRYSANYNDMTVNRIGVIDMACEEYSQEVLGFSDVIANLSVEEKAALIKVLKSHKQAIAWKLSDIKGINSKFCTHKILMEDDFELAVQHQTRVNLKIHDVIKKEVLKPLDSGLIYPISDSPWEKSHSMVKERVVLGHKIYKNRIEVDKAKVDVIAKLPHPTTIKGISRFLGHAGFYQQFIQDFSKIARPMTRLLKKDTSFFFSKACVEAFQKLKRKLTEAPILIAPDWDLPFELMYDASDFAIGAVLGQRHEKHFSPIHYASKTMTEAESHYTTTEKEMLAVVYAFEKFWSYLIMNKSIVYTDHSALKYLFAKKDSKARLL